MWTGRPSPHLDVCEQGGRVVDAGGDTLLIGGQGLQLAQQVPHALQLVGRHLNLAPRRLGRGGLRLDVVALVHVDHISAGRVAGGWLNQA